MVRESPFFEFVSVYRNQSKCWKISSLMTEAEPGRNSPARSTLHSRRTMRAIAAAAIAGGLVLAGFSADVALAASPAGGWSVAGNLSTQRPGSMLSVALTDGRVMIAGASSTDYTAIGNVDLFDPAHGWSLGPRLNGDPNAAVMAPLPDGGALLAGGTPWFGGFDGPGPDPTANALTYDPASATWNSAPSMSRRRNNAAAAALADGRVLVAGGYDRKVIQLPNPDQIPFCCLQIDMIPLATSEIFDPRTRAWSPAGDLGHARYGQAAVTLKGGQVLMLGGEDQSQNPPAYLASAELFDPSTDKWTAAGDIGRPRSGFTLTPLADGRALLAGGLAADGVTVLRSTLLYDPSQNSWTPGPDMKEARTNHGAARMKDGRVLVSGGIDHIGRIASAEVFDPATATWDETGALHTARSDHATVALLDGRVLVAGGRGLHGGLADSELFDARAAGTPPASRTTAGPGTWTTRPAMPSPSYVQDAHLLKDGRVLVLPGAGYASYSAQIYDPGTGAWTTSFTRATDQQFISAVAMADGDVLLLTLDSQGVKPAKAEVIDPLSGASRPVTSPGTWGTARLVLLADGRVWLTGAPYGEKRTAIYDPASDRWSSGPDVPANLYVATVTPIPGDRLLVGGILTAMILDFKSGWSEVLGFPAHWNNYSATALPGGDVLLAGGTEDQTQPDNRVIPVASSRMLRWNHTNGMLESARAMPAPQPFHSTVVLQDGRVLFAGGVVSGDAEADPVAMAEIYDPISDSWTAAQSMPEARSQMTAVLMAGGTVLEVGGYGLFNPAGTLVYKPAPAALASPRPVGVAAATPRPSTAALLAALAIFLAAVVASGLLVADARRRRSARRS